ncbi:MAG TPA: peptidoglycan editing factor PgeF [Gammaproteobacteria bacterium]|nr:peptidoglycan editing factor PgeF [Gammaproteobacteria bacterium]
MSNPELEILRADLNIPGVHVGTTTRLGGSSHAPYHSLNLATHVGDEESAVAANRARLEQTLVLPSQPCWLQQVHGKQVYRIKTSSQGLTADGSYTDTPGVVLAVLTADCLPVVLASEKGDEVAVVHAGWRGLAAGVIESALQLFSCEQTAIQAWLGPAIGMQNYEVDRQVYDAFMSIDTQHQPAFASSRSGHWHANLYTLACQRLQHMGVRQIRGGGQTATWCSYEQDELFFSYRRDGDTGRMATLAWLEPE